MPFQFDEFDKFLEKCYFVKRPYSEKDLSDYLILRNTAYQRVAGINGALSHISHNKILLLRHLKRKFEIAFAQSESFNVRLVELFSVQIYCSVDVNFDPISRKPDYTLDQKLVVPSKSAKISAVKAGCFGKQDDVAV